MFKDKLYIRGVVTATVFGPDGMVKQRERGFIRRLFNIPGEWMISREHNLVVTTGDRLIADAVSYTAARQPVNGTYGQMQVGTGFVSATKGTTALTTPTGTAQVLDATYPKLQAAWGNAGASVVLYQVTFGPGSLNANGINEAILENTTPDALAYAQITPSVNVTAVDSLQVNWAITLLGS